MGLVLKTIRNSAHTPGLNELYKEVNRLGIQEIIRENSILVFVGIARWSRKTIKFMNASIILVKIHSKMRAFTKNRPVAGPGKFGNELFFSNL